MRSSTSSMPTDSRTRSAGTSSAVPATLEVPADLVRLSVGIEDVQDLIDDLDKALTATA